VCYDCSNWKTVRPGVECCPDCVLKFKTRVLCGGCKRPVDLKTVRFVCSCCKRSKCDRCDKKGIPDIDVSPITLYGSGYSVARSTAVCGKCLPPGNTKTCIKAVQDAYRDYDRYVCSGHSTFAEQLKLAGFVVCSRYTTTSGNAAVTVRLLSNSKCSYYENNDPSKNIWDEARAFCDSHPGVEVKYDNTGYHFCDPPNIEVVLQLESGGLIVVESPQPPTYTTVIVWKTASIDQPAYRMGTASTPRYQRGGNRLVEFENGRDTIFYGDAIMGTLQADGVSEAVWELDHRQFECAYVGDKSGILIKPTAKPGPLMTEFVTSTGHPVKIHPNGTIETTAPVKVPLKSVVFGDGTVAVVDAEGRTARFPSLLSYSRTPCWFDGKKLLRSAVAEGKRPPPKKMKGAAP